MSEQDKKTIGDALYMPRADEIEFEAPRLGSSGAAATEFEIDRLRQQLSEARGKIEELTSALSDECADTYGIGYKEAYQGLREISTAKDERIASLEAVIEFYADPATYHAIAFLADPPCGEFMDDFSEDHGDEYDRPMPGRRARELLKGTEDA